LPRPRTRPVVLGSVLALLTAWGGAALPARAGGAFVWTFPGNCPTDVLQDCVDASDPGDTILIATDDPIHEVVSVDHTLTIQPDTGFHPTVAVIGIGDGSTGTLGVFLSGLRIPGGVLVRLTAGSGHVVSLRDLDLESSQAVGSALFADLRVPSSVELTSSRLKETVDEGSALEVEAASPSGLVAFRAVGNRIRGNRGEQGGGGITLRTSRAGSVRADFLNNTVWGARACCASDAGISLEPQGLSHADVDIVGNTIDHTGGDALGVRSFLFAAGHISIDAFDNVFSNSRLSAINIDSARPATLDFRAGHSDFFNNGDPNFLEGHSTGSGNLQVNPQFVGAATGALVLKPTSPLIDRGLVCSPGGVADPDAVGHARLSGPSVDMGAFERGSGPPTGDVFLGTVGGDMLDGTPGADILCGMGGPDDLRGGGGRDFVDGGRGEDVLFGNGGPDRLFGGPGNDPCLFTADGVEGNDRADGGLGNDGFLSDPGDVLVNVEHHSPCN